MPAKRRDHGREFRRVGILSHHVLGLPDEHHPRVRMSGDHIRQGIDQIFDPFFGGQARHHPDHLVRIRDVVFFPGRLQFRTQ